MIFINLMSGLLASWVSGAHAESFRLVQSLIVSRHGIRSPYPPTNGTVTDYSSYTYKVFPDNNTWGMTFEAFSDQHLTPHGEITLPYVGGYYSESLAAAGMDLSPSCENIVCFADDNSRDINSAHLWLQGFNCPDIPVLVVNSTSYASMQPVLSDHFDTGCPLATEEQVNGLYGGDVDALTDMYSDEIDMVNQILDMQNYDAKICQNVNPDYDNSVTCTLFETGYEYTGLYYQGMFVSPFYYAQYFAESWMYQYVSNLTEWGFGMLSLSQLTDLNVMHVESMSFGANHWNALAYSSQQLAYIVASIEQFVTGKSLKGVEQDKDTQLLLLLSHDMNILYLRELLDINWVSFGYSDGVATTAGALAFDLYRSDLDGSYYVKVHYDAATPSQQRFATELSLDKPPSVAELVVPLCGALMCPWETFRQAALSLIDLDCVQEPLRTTVSSIMGSGKGDDDSVNRGYEDYKVILVTGAVLIVAFAAIFGLYVYNSKKGVGRDDTIPIFNSDLS